MRQSFFCQLAFLSTVLASGMYSLPATAEIQPTEINDRQIEVASPQLEVAQTSLPAINPITKPLTNSTTNFTRRSPLPVQSQIVTVVRDSTVEWTNIATTLQGTNYKVLSLENLNKQALSDVGFLLLPNLETISSAQVEVLKEWVASGGKLIVTGSLGRKSTPDVQAKLRSLLGGYWSSHLGEPTNLVVRSQADNRWALSIPKVSTTIVDSGGTLVATDRNSVAVASWSGNSAAVLANQNILFLGWQWGTAKERQVYDRSWLAAAVNRFTAVNSTQSNPDIPAIATPEPRISTNEATYMRQDLQEAIGRIESGIASAQIANLNSQSRSTVASFSKPGSLPSIVAAKQFINDMPDSIRDGKYGEVRMQWQQIRQNLAKDYPMNPLTALPEVRAIWLDRGTIVSARSERQLALVFDRMAAAGVNTVFLETVNAGYPIYPSSVAPQQNPLIRGWDPLATAVKLAHERKMELHAWVWVFSAGNRRHNLLIGKPSDYIGPVLEVHPDWANRSQNGEIFTPEGKPFLDPANPQVQDYLLRLYREIVTRYKVDGIHLDYIRYPRQEFGADFGFSVASRSQFQALTGVDPVSITVNHPSLWRMWTEFRAQQVNQFVARVSKEMKQLKPDLTISAAVFPWRNAERMNTIQQDWEVWIAKGDVDLIVPMTYASDTSSFLRQQVQPTLASITQSPVLFLPGVLLRDIQDTELLDRIQAVRDLPSGGYSLFAAEHLHPSFERLFKYTKTGQDSQILPHRKPFAAAMSRYAMLKQEWDALVKMDSILVKGENLQIWQAQSETLSQALSTLNQQPSQANLKTAMSALTKMSSGLPTWMRDEKTERPYRIAAWSNRLSAIAALLRYGDRRSMFQSTPTAAITRTSNASN
ncbi:family 10 glycosylhydrolase [Pseudanabaena sp. PCC 6802]|uniref:family 10 glycosylhydrolase n=1 Tax=Pseudanabaena sp. PCC 6802 TaxID=118173 RepID=UPI00035D0804|nr:family 10 glycosylhydrolase [Pseudanabaena sp. PCC 6802]